MIQDPDAPFQYLMIEQVIPSKTNPRKRFSEQHLNELADNIRQYGVMQPILVRPIAGKKPTFEIVAGERRWRASKIAEQTHIPAMVREMPDLDALRMQVFENLHRDDLHPMEEAEGFSQLLRKSQDLIGMTVDELALKVGKSRAYIYASLKLLALCQEAREAFLDDKFSASVALLIARIPGAKLQAEAMKCTVTWNGQPASYREVANNIQSRFTLSLNRAVFDITDASLVEDAGDCTSCSKLSGNCRDICPDIESADVCTDPDCFAAKRDAHFERIIVNTKTQGGRVIEGDEVKKILPFGQYGTPEDGYRRVTGACRIDGVTGTFEELLGSDLPVPTVLVLADKSVLQVYQEDELNAKVQSKIEAGEIQLLPAEARQPNKWEIEKAAREAKQAPEIARRLKLFNALAKDLIANDDVPPLRMAVINSIWFYDQDGVYGNALDAIAEAYGWPEDGRRTFIADYISADRSTNDLIRLLCLLTVVNGIDVPYAWDGSGDDENENETCDLDRLESMAISRGIDPDDPEPESAPSPSTAAQAQDLNALVSEAKLKPFKDIKARTLAKRQRRTGKKESAVADSDVLPAADAPGVESASSEDLVAA
jgi:ParB/RepB/Spo0J family partition protein